MTESAIKPTDIKLHQQSRVLEISFEDGKTFKLPCEYLRCFSPSAEVRGHGPGQETLQVGENQEKYWSDYLEKLKAAGHTRKTS
jgi:DUF971 family protein